MKVDTPKSEVYSRGIQSSEAYQIKSSQKMFNMLSDMLYSDKVLAPIRELSTNAYDAHVEAGTTYISPIIQCPSKADLTFSIRDFGTGLSEEQVYNLYRVYGASSKDSSNLYNGCMGIGSKSPFAYTDSFTVVSYYNGYKNTYINNKYGNNGSPTIEKLGESETDEHNGLQISFVVKPEDVADFRERIAKVVQYFPEQFKVVDQSGKYKDIEKKILYEGKNWRIYKGHAKNATAIMGYIGYPIDVRSLKNNNYGPEYNLCQSNIEIDFDIGEVEMDISREQLQYNNKTINAINSRIQDVLIEIQSSIQKKVDKCKSLYEARLLIYDIPYNITKLTTEFTYKNKKIQEICIPPNVKVSRCIYSNNRMTYQIQRLPYSLFTFYINDTNKPYIISVKKDVQDKNLDGFIFKFEDKRDEENFLEHIGLTTNDVVYVSSLKNSPIKKKRGVKKKTVKIQKYIYRQYKGLLWKYWKSITVDITKTEYYVPLDHGKICFGKTSRIHPHILKDIVTLLPKLKDRDIYGVPKSIIKQIDKSKWTNVADLIVDKIKLLGDDIARYEKCTNYSLYRYNKAKELLDNIGDIEDHKLKKILNVFIENQKSASLISSARQIRSQLPSYLQPELPKVNFDEEHTKLLDKYPLLDSMLDIRQMTETNAKHLVIYLNAVHNQ